MHNLIFFVRQVIRLRRFQQESDVFALAVVLWEIVVGELPYKDENNQAAVRGKVFFTFVSIVKQHVCIAIKLVLGSMASFMFVLLSFIGCFGLSSAPTSERVVSPHTRVVARRSQCTADSLRFLFKNLLQLYSTDTRHMLSVSLFACQLSQMSPVA